MTIQKETGRKLIQLSVKPNFYEQIMTYCDELDMPVTVWARELIKRELGVPSVPIDVESFVLRKEAKNCQFWEDVLENTFLPLQLQSNNDEFTTHQLTAWILNYSGIELLEADRFKNKGGNPIWRDRMHRAIKKLVAKGHLEKSHNSGSYLIRRP